MKVNGMDRNVVRTQSMPQLPEPTSLPLPVSPVRPPAPIPGPVAVVAPETRAAGAAAVLQPHQRIPRWLERAELFIRVLLRMYIGIAVCYVPWSRMFWDQNPIFFHNPTLGSIAANGAVRGLVSGLGLLNLWIAFRDAMGKGREGELKK
jgi:hypothetical protein